VESWGWFVRFMWMMKLGGPALMLAGPPCRARAGDTSFLFLPAPRISGPLNILFVIDLTIFFKRIFH